MKNLQIVSGFLLFSISLVALSVFAQGAPEAMPVTFVKLLYSCSSYHPSSPLCGTGENPPGAQTITVNDKVDPNTQGPKADSVRVYYADGTNVMYVKAGSGR